MDCEKAGTEECLRCVGARWDPDARDARWVVRSTEREGAQFRTRLTEILGTQIPFRWQQELIVVLPQDQQILDDAWRWAEADELELHLFGRNGAQMYDLSEHSTDVVREIQMRLTAQGFKNWTTDREILLVPKQLEALVDAAYAEIDEAGVTDGKKLGGGPSEHLRENSASLAGKTLERHLRLSRRWQRLHLQPKAVSELADAAAEEMLASAEWSAIVGDRIDTTQATQLLGISRQALSKRQISGSALGVPGHRTTHFPIWQFDQEGKSIWPEVRLVLGVFRDHVPLAELDPLLIASWAKTPQPEDLGGMTPAAWIQARNDPAQLEQAARRAAERLAG